ncbi:LysR family transcriptional regulator [Acetobacterium woodii]|uniref:Transcriptional regulator LysR family n=1 Tax=Acetobacterium woodii (strain ATCC 29683 / DSM 1030 / JCM 2381 / KCTC 1655 / WB1) TaxID=931626 RepID=H6LB58_ACEWD|nr:LysR family transcriptional regulator [Acetobacterium woodii]AFA47610.1 transcriptional regulator LysR family [Acetobacterium woodii DSM 1030]
MRLTYLNTFVEVIKHQSISKAADELFLSQPAVTKQLKIIEEYYGVTLLLRHDHKTLPTREGKQLYCCAQNILTENNELLRSFKNELNDSTGHIDLIASNYPAHYILPDLIKERSQSYENITYSIKTTDSQDTYYHVRNGLFSFGFVGLKKEIPNIETLEISRASMVLVGSKQKYHFLLDQPEKIKDQNFILRAKGSGTLHEIKKRLEHLNMDRIKTFVECDSNEMVKKLILSGIGIGYFFENALKPSIDDHSLIILDEKKIERQFFYIYNTQKYKSISENSFHHYILNKYANQ